ncbi:MAG: MBL fold metallo-hydrolase [Akkermansiaceae bacterium]|nr:MBL fold metallo-hydrolase [Akkermansiaceae bacterium]
MATPSPENSRRKFLGSLSAAFATVGASGSLASGASAEMRAPLPKKTISNPYIYEFSIGKFEAWSISDGYGTFKQGVSKKMWPPADRAEMTKTLVARGERPDDTTLYINILVLRKDKEVILVDAGFGPNPNPTWGWLASALDSIGIQVRDVTHAMLSHSHGDHIGGLASDGKILFPNAAIHVLKREVDFWRSPTPDFSKSHRTDDIQQMIQNVRNAFDTLQPNLVIHEDGDQILDGAITLIAASGHTDGHAIFRIQSHGQSLLHISDLAHHHVLMLEDPNWFIDFDHDPASAIAARKKVFAELALTHERTFGFHLPWPGLGIIAPNGRKGYQWIPASWRWDF